MIPGENITKGFLEAIEEGDFHRFYAANDGSLWIVGFYEGEGEHKDNPEDDDPYAFATLTSKDGQWLWKGQSPGNFDEFFSYAAEFNDINEFREVIEKYKQERSIKPPGLTPEM